MAEKCGHCGERDAAARVRKVGASGQGVPRCARCISEANDPYTEILRLET